MNEKPVPLSRSVQRTSIPFDLDTMTGFPNWRERFFWPISPLELDRVFSDSIDAYIALIASTEAERMRRLLIGVSGISLRLFWPLVEYALCLEREEKFAVRFECSRPEFAFLRGESDLPGLVGDKSREPWRTVSPRYPVIRGILNSSRLNSPWRLPRALVAPEAIAISLNGLLDEMALRKNAAIGYRDAATIMLAARRQRPRHDLDIDRLASDIAAIQVRCSGLGATYRDRLKRLVEHKLRPVLDRAAADQVKLEATSSVPDALWSGTGAKYVSRMIGLESLRRGGTAVRFDHGGSNGLSGLLKNFSLSELAASSKFVMATPRLASLMQQCEARTVLQESANTEIIGASGWPNVRGLPHGPRHRAGRRLQVMYVSSFSDSHSKNRVHTLSELAYHDWSLRLGEMLAALPIDLMIKPHPQAPTPGGRHPLEGVAKVVFDRFEEVMDWADVFVYDTVNSTTFWEAVCSDRTIVYVEHRGLGVNPAVEQMFRRRCHVLEVEFDDSNRAFLNPAALAEAIQGNGLKGDPQEFRELFLGST